MGRSLGKGMREFKDSIGSTKDEFLGEERAEPVLEERRPAA